MFELKLENSYGNAVDLDDNIRYVVTDITGINPPSASLFKSKSPNRKGTKHNGSTLDERQITIFVKILGNVEENRNYLYNWVDTEEYVKIHYRNGVKNVYCEGYVEDCDFSTFTDNEIISVVISCDDPYWKDLLDIVTEVSNILKEFTIPFSITNPIPFSTIRTSNTTNIFNYGNETGLVFNIKCLDEVSGLVIYDPNNTLRRFEINAKLEKNWTIIIDTESSPKTIKAYKPDGSVENLLKYVRRNPTWFTLRKGNNTFGFEANGNESNIELTIKYTNKHLGV